MQVLILIISLACYGFGPVGMDLSHRSGLVNIKTAFFIVKYIPIISMLKYEQKKKKQIELCSRFL